MKKPAKSTHHAAVNTPTNSNRNPAPVVIDTPQKQQTAKEAIAANVQLLIEQLEQGHSEGLTAVSYPSVNSIEPAGVRCTRRQISSVPGPTQVAAFRCIQQVGDRLPPVTAMLTLVANSSGLEL